MGTSYKARARRHVLQAEKVNTTEHLEKAKHAMENATTPAAFHAAAARFEELSAKAAMLKRKLKRRKKATSWF